MRSTRKRDSANPTFLDEKGEPWEQPGLGIPSVRVKLEVPPPYDRKALRSGIHRVKRQVVWVLRGLRALSELNDKGVLLPDIASALGVPAPRSVFRKSPGYKPKPGTDSAFILALLKLAGQVGLSEDELVIKLQSAGRLRAAQFPKRAVHCSLTNLQKRAQLVERDAATKNWRSAHRPRVCLDIATDGRDRLSSTTPAPATSGAAEIALATNASSEVQRE